MRCQYFDRKASAGWRTAWTIELSGYYAGLGAVCYRRQEYIEQTERRRA